MRQLLMATALVACVALVAPCANAEDVPSGMVAAFAGRTQCPNGWLPYTESSGRYIRGADWQGSAASGTGPSDATAGSITIEQTNLPSLSIDLNSQIRAVPSYVQPPLFSANTIQLFGRAADEPGWNNSMRDSGLRVDLGGHGTAINLPPSQPATMTLMMCRKR